jgi:hypothetical protein
MKKIRQYSAKISIVFSLSILLVSCSQYESSEISQSNLKTYSGEELFKGIFFFQNEISEKIPQIKELKEKTFKITNDKNQVNQILNNLSNLSVDFINTNYPGFFKKFQSTIYSNDLFEIDKIINQASQLIEQTAIQSKEFSSIFNFAKALETDINLRNEIAKIDLNTEEGKNAMEELTKKYINKIEINNAVKTKYLCVTVFYAIAAVVSIAAVVYSVYAKVVYWGPKMLKSNFEDPLSNNKLYSIDRELFIGEIAVMLKQ